MLSRQHFVALDGLRGVAAILLVSMHAIEPFGYFYLVPHAYLAVDFFFCLSGFVVGYAYENRLRDSMSFLEFFKVRMIRLYPLIFLCTLLGLATYLVNALHDNEKMDLAKLITIFFAELALFPTPLTLQKTWIGYTPFDPPAWSLFFELLANFIYALSVRRLSNMMLAALLVVAASITLVTSFLADGLVDGNQWERLDIGAVRVTFPFLCGLALFRLSRCVRSDRTAANKFMLVPWLIAVLICPVPPSWNWLYTGCAVILAFPAIVWIAAQAQVAVPGFGTAAYLLLGRLSYPLYISHYTVVRVFSKAIRSYDLHGKTFWLAIGLELLSSLAFAVLLMKFIDEPVRAWLGEKWRPVRAREIVDSGSVS